MNYDFVYVCDTSLHLVECDMEENTDKNEETPETSHAEGALSCQKYVGKQIHCRLILKMSSMLSLC